MSHWKLCAVLLLAVPSAAAAQHDHEMPASTAPGTRFTARFGAHGVALLTHVSPILHGESMTEGYFTQPMLLGQATFGGALSAQAAVSLEEFTLERGELGAGSYGEGYVDRRHPHTLLHELIVTASRDVGDVMFSLSAGRGFAPFGTDDPMMRPFVKFPVNHHLGQVLERLVAIGGVRYGPVLLEGALFNGDEPMNSRSLGTLDRFGDSWSARAALLPIEGLEVQGSYAWLTSPENPDGIGWDQRKWSASARYGTPTLYVLAEWKRTSELDRGTELFSFGSILAEAQAEWRGWRPAIRLERSERPEEERLSDPFRTRWPHTDSHFLGITEWNIISARIERSVTASGVRITPFIEASHTDVAETGDGVFDPREFYGDTNIWTLNLGARLGFGWHPSRMGRYGVAAQSGDAHSH